MRAQPFAGWGNSEAGFGQVARNVAQIKKKETKR